MRQKELRIALVCYGGISLAVYMHGITKEIWRATRASRNFHAGDPPASGSQAIYRELFEAFAAQSQVKLRLLPDIIAGASAGGINGVFLAQALTSGQSLEPLTRMWLECADIDRLLDPDARPFSRFTKFWAQPLVWLLLRRPGGALDRSVAPEARAEVRTKLSRLVRARWFAPPFSGTGFSALLYEAMEAMAATPAGPRLLPLGQPLDLFVTVTDFRGHLERLRLNSPAEVVETEHRLSIGFRYLRGRDDSLADPAELVFAARATASFPGAFPPFNVAEMDRMLARREKHWPGREAFLARVFPQQYAAGEAESAVLIDGSVLANAPFAQAIDALRDRPAHREIDRRFVYIDPKPDLAGGMDQSRERDAMGQRLPGFFSTIFGAISDIPREQPIRDNLEGIERRSSRVRQMRAITDALRAEVEETVSKLFGYTLFLDSPTPQRLTKWRNKAQDRAAHMAGFAYASYAQLKLATIVEDMVDIARDRAASRPVGGGLAGTAARGRSRGDTGHRCGMDGAALRARERRGERRGPVTVLPHPGSGVPHPPPALPGAAAGRGHRWQARARRTARSGGGDARRALRAALALYARPGGRATFSVRALPMLAAARDRRPGDGARRSWTRSRRTAACGARDGRVRTMQPGRRPRRRCRAKAGRRSHAARLSRLPLL